LPNVVRIQVPAVIHEPRFGQGPEARRSLEEMAGQLRELPASWFPNLAEAADEVIGPGLTDRYELGLTSILNGLRQSSTHTPAPDHR
jgi:TetR/AcrR family transcriptional regulator, tetracycline repressor protein